MSYPKHIQYLVDNFSQLLLKRLEKEGRSVPINQAMEVFVQADPTQGKRLVD